MLSTFVCRNKNNSRRHFKTFLLFVSRTKDFSFHARSLIKRQSLWNATPYVLGKTHKKLSSAEFAQRVLRAHSVQYWNWSIYAVHNSLNHSHSQGKLSKRQTDLYFFRESTIVGLAFQTNCLRRDDLHEIPNHTFYFAWNAKSYLSGK